MTLDRLLQVRNYVSQGCKGAAPQGVRISRVTHLNIELERPYRLDLDLFGDRLGIDKSLSSHPSRVVRLNGFEELYFLSRYPSGVLFSIGFGHAHLGSSMNGHFSQFYEATIHTTEDAVSRLALAIAAECIVVNSKGGPLTEAA